MVNVHPSTTNKSLYERFGLTKCRYGSIRLDVTTSVFLLTQGTPLLGTKLALLVCIRACTNCGINEMKSNEVKRIKY